MSHQAASDTQITRTSSRPVCQFGNVKGLNGAATVRVDDIMTVEQRVCTEKTRRSDILLKSIQH